MTVRLDVPCQDLMNGWWTHCAEEFFQRLGHEQDALTLPTTVAVDGQRLERWIWKMLVQESPKLPGIGESGCNSFG